jgi:hypothetical protein
MQISNTDISGIIWRRSSRSGETGDNCVEVASVGGGIAVRDSKDPAQGHLIFDAAAWSAFTQDLKRQ